MTAVHSVQHQQNFTKHDGTGLMNHLVWSDYKVALRTLNEKQRERVKQKKARGKTQEMFRLRRIMEGYSIFKPVHQKTR